MRSTSARHGLPMHGMPKQSSWLANQPIRRKLILAFGLVIGLFVLSSYGSFKSLAQRSVASAWTVHTYAVIDEALGMDLALREQQTGVRGYLISAAPSQRSIYDSGGVDFDRHISRLRTLTADNPAQQVRLQQIDEAVRGWRREATAAMQRIQPIATAGSESQAADRASAIAYIYRVTPQLSLIQQLFGELENTERRL
ncbi:MAG TPA: CHASE3 domain-containing protein, partial [Luteimonas sp.]|nr:CHASE3 domain-containing protein [Luteimonas sp.]